MQNRKILKACFAWLCLLLWPAVTIAQQPGYQDIYVATLNANRVWPCGNPGSVTQQVITALQTVQYKGGGTVDLGCYATGPVLTQNPFTGITAPVTLILGPNQTTIDANVTIPSNVTLLYRQGSEILAGFGFTLTDHSTPFRSAPGFQQLVYAPSAAPTPTATTGGAFTPPVTLFYVVTATISGGETNPSAEATISLTAGQTAVSLTWPSVTNATGYKIYRGTSSGGENVYYTSSVNSFTDVDGTSTAGSPPTTTTAWIFVTGGGGGGGSNVTVNGGGTLATANFNDAAPAASACSQDVLWQNSGANVSAQLLLNLGNNCQVFDASKQSGADFGVKVMNALAAAYAAGGGTVDARGFSCPANCQIGTENLTLGDGVHYVTLLWPAGTVTRGVLTSGSSAQVLYNSHVTSVGNGTTLSGATDTDALIQAAVGSGVSDAHFVGALTIVGTGTITTNSNAVEIGGPDPAGLTSPDPANVSYTTNALQSNLFTPEFYSADVAHYALYNYALSSTQIANHYAAGNTPGSGYVAAVTADTPFSYWQYADTSGTTAVDSTGGRNGTYTGGVTLGVDASIPGDSGAKSANLDGSSGNVTFPVYNWFSSSDFTFEGWVKPFSGAGQQPIMSFVDGTGSNAIGFADESTAWGGMYARLTIAGVITRTIFPQTALGTGSWVYVVYVQHGGTMDLYLNGVKQRAGTDVSSSTFADLSTSGFDRGIDLNSQHGCVCYLRFNNISATAQSIGLATYNNSGYSYGVNSNHFQSVKTSAPLGVLLSGGTVNQFDGVPDIENAVWEDGTNRAVFAQATSGYRGASYVKGDVITPTLGCTVNPTFTVNYTGAGGAVGSDDSPTQQGLALLTHGSGCPSGTTNSVAVTGGTGTGLEVNVTVNGFVVLTDYAAGWETAYEENGATDVLCGGANYVFGAAGATGNGGYYSPNLCPGTTSIYGGPLSNFWWGPGRTPYSIGLKGAQGYIAFTSNFMYDSYASYADQPSPAYGSDLFGNGMVYGGAASQIYGRWGYSEWNMGLSQPHGGVSSTGRVSVGALANPATPTLTAINGTGTTSDVYGLVCTDGNSGHTLVSTPVTTVSGPATLGAIQSATVNSGGTAYVQADVGATLTITGNAGFGSGGTLTITQVNGGSGSGPVTGIALAAAGSHYNPWPFPGGSHSNSFATVGGTGTGLTVQLTVAAIEVTLPHENGCQSWTVLKTDTGHSLQNVNTYATGSTDASSNIYDVGNTESTVTWTVTRSTTGDMLVVDHLGFTGTVPSDGATVACFDPAGFLSTGCSSAGAVSSVSNSDGTLTISPTTGAVVASLALGHANTWTAVQTFGTDISIGGQTLSGGVQGAGDTKAMLAGTVTGTGAGLCTDANGGATTSGCTAGSGTVTSFSAGNLSPLFSTAVATSTTTPALSFTLSNAAAFTLFANNTSSSAGPSYVSFDTLFGSCSTGSSALTYSTSTHTFGCNSISGSGTVNAASQYSFAYYPNSGSAAVVGGVASPTANGFYQVGYNITGAAAAAPSTYLAGLTNRAVTGTTSTDTILYSDNINYVQYQGSVAVAATLPTATTLGNSHFVTRLINHTSGSATAVTVTPTTWTVNGASTLTIAQGQACTFTVDAAGSSWDANCNNGQLAAGTGITLTPTQYGTTVTNAGVTAYPGAGLPISTGSAWGTSLSETDGQMIYGASGAWTKSSTPTLGASGTLGSMTFGNATNGLLTLEPIPGALGTVTMYVPVPVNSPGTLTQTVASGTAAMGTGAITSGTCATAVTATATGAATTDVLAASPNTDPTGVTGYAPSASGSLYIQAWLTSNTANFKVCNNTSGSITPSALTLNWRVSR